VNVARIAGLLPPSFAGLYFFFSRRVKYTYPKQTDLQIAKEVLADRVRRTGWDGQGPGSNPIHPTPTTPSSPQPVAAITRFGSWLQVLIIRLCFGTGVRLLTGLGAGFTLLGFFNVASAALGGTAAYLLWRRRSKGVTIAKIFLITDGLYYLMALIDSLSGAAAQGGDAQPWFRHSGYLVISVLFLLYLTYSKRVKSIYYPAYFSYPSAHGEGNRQPSQRKVWPSLTKPTEHDNPELQSVLIPKELLLRVDERLHAMSHHLVGRIATPLPRKSSSSRDSEPVWGGRPQNAHVLFDDH
jgi:hypothetical protein